MAAGDQIVDSSFSCENKPFFRDKFVLLITICIFNAYTWNILFFRIIRKILDHLHIPIHHVPDLLHVKVNPYYLSLHCITLRGPSTSAEMSFRIVCPLQVVMLGYNLTTAEVVAITANTTNNLTASIITNCHLTMTATSPTTGSCLRYKRPTDILGSRTGTIPRSLRPRGLAWGWGTTPPIPCMKP